MKVSEIFESVQGEGEYLGQRALFIRLHGCNLKCDFCDSKYTWNGVVWQLTVENVVESIEKSHCYHVVFTGGEPMLQQKEIHRVVMGVPGGKFYEIETNGTISPTIEHAIHLFTVSPKGNFRVARKFFTLKNVVFKFVVDTTMDLRKIEDFVQLHRVKVPIYLMPQTISLEGHQRKLPMLFDFLKTHPQPDYRITPRLHVLAFGNKRGV